MVLHIVNAVNKWARKGTSFLALVCNESKACITRPVANVTEPGDAARLEQCQTDHIVLIINANVMVGHEGIV